MMSSAFTGCFATRRGTQPMAVSLVKCRNAVAGHPVSALRVSFSAPMALLRLLQRGTAIPGEVCLAMGAEKLTESIIITLMKY